MLALGWFTWRWPGARLLHVVLGLAHLPLRPALGWFLGWRLALRRLAFYNKPCACNRGGAVAPPAH